MPLPVPRTSLSVALIATALLSACNAATAPSDGRIEALQFSGPRSLPNPTGGNLLRGWVVEYNAADGGVEPGSSEIPRGATGTISGGSQGPQAVSFTSQDLVVNVNRADGDVITSPQDYARAYTAGIEQGFDVASVDFRGSGYVYVSRVVVGDFVNREGEGQSGLAILGTRTESANLPTRTATFRGEVQGALVQGNRATAGISGQFSLTTDFVNSATIETNNTAITSSSGTSSAPALDFSGTGGVSSGRTFYAIGVNSAGLDASGSVRGSFYGPRAEETGGAFRLANDEFEYFGTLQGRR